MLFKASAMYVNDAGGLRHTFRMVATARTTNAGNADQTVPNVSIISS